MQTKIRPRSPDYAAYDSVLNPHRHAGEWQRFYEQGIARTAALRAEVRNETNVFYGRHPAQILDIYYPAQLQPAAPVLIFLHGGAFREGHPAQYGFLGGPHVERGTIFVCAGYRVAPDCYFPGTIDDLAQLIGWVFHNIAVRGGNPRRIVLAGHAAGAVLAALACVRNDWQVDVDVPEDVLRSVILSGVNYDWRPDHTSVLFNVARAPKRALLTLGALETDEAGEERAESSVHRWAQAMQARGTNARILELPHADPRTSCKALADVDAPVFDAAVRIIEGRAWID